MVSLRARIMCDGWREHGDTRTCMTVIEGSVFIASVVTDLNKLAKERGWKRMKASYRADVSYICPSCQAQVKAKKEQPQ